MERQRTAEILFAEALEAECAAATLQGAARQAKLRKAARLLDEAIAAA